MPDRWLAVLCAVAGLILLAIGVAIAVATGGVRGEATYPLIAGVALLAAYALLDPAGVRDMVTTRRGRVGATSVVFAAAVVTLLVLVNVLTAGATQFVDLSRFKVNTLRPESIAIAKKVDAPLQAVLWDVPSDASYNDTLALLRRYQAANGNIHVSTADRDLDPAGAKRDGVVGDGTVVLKYRGRTQLLAPGSTAEQDVSSAILKVESDRSPIVCWVVGDGERDLTNTDEVKGYSVAADQLAKDNLTERDLLLSQATSVPADCDAVAVVGPQKALADTAQQALADYLGHGGHLLLVLDSWLDPGVVARYNELLKPYGESFSGGLVVPDRAHAIRGEPTATGAFDYGASSITKDLANRLSVFPESTSITSQAAAGTTATALVRTSPDAYLVQQPRQDYATRQSGDAPGPFTLMTTVEGTPSGGSGQSRLVLIGTSAVAENVVLNGTGGINVQLLTGSLDWLAEQDQLLTLPPRGQAAQLVLTEQDAALNVLLVLVLLPLLLVAGGLGVWGRRRFVG